MAGLMLDWMNPANKKRGASKSLHLVSCRSFLNYLPDGLLSDLSGPAVPELPAAEPEEPVPCGFDGVTVEYGLVAAPEAPELPMSLDLELVVPEEPELEGLLVPMLPQAARANTHAKGMIQFFMKNSLKEIEETA